MAQGQLASVDSGVFPSLLTLEFLFSQRSLRWNCKTRKRSNSCSFGRFAHLGKRRNLARRSGKPPDLPHDRERLRV